MHKHDPMFVLGNKRNTQRS